MGQSAKLILFAPILFFSISATSAQNNGDTIKNIGEARLCIRNANLARARVINDDVVDFEMRDGTIFRNILLTSCPLLRDSDRFSYRQFTKSSLCRGDQISSLETVGDRLQIFGRCGLGTFQQIEKSPEIYSE